jgi:hypothetical protein
MDLARETITDLIRSAWLIESARHTLFSHWAGKDPITWAARAEWADKRAGLIEEALAELERTPDQHLLGLHAKWLRGVVGDTPDEVPLGDLFVARLGDWVEAHVAGFVGERIDDLKRWGQAERETLRFPDALPSPPPYEPVATVEVEAPGDVRFRFAIIGDLHFGSPGADAMAEAAITDINRSGAELAIQLGDITDHGRRDEFEAATKALSRLEMECTTMMGNHDVLSIGEQEVLGRELYGGTFGREADGVLLEHEGFRFAVLDSATHAASPFPPFNFVTGSFLEGPGGALVHGSLTSPQHDILAEVASPGSPPAFVFLHHPPQPFVAFPPILFGLREADSGRLHATADSGNVWGVFAGHTHRNARTTTFGDVPVHEVAIPRDFPFGYCLVDVSDEGYAFRFVQISDEALLRESYKSASSIHRRYGLGAAQERGFEWRRDRTS